MRGEEFRESMKNIDLKREEFRENMKNIGLKRGKFRAKGGGVQGEYEEY